jgi:hypothetical protein
MNQIKSWVCSQRESALRRSTELDKQLQENLHELSVCQVRLFHWLSNIKTCLFGIRDFGRLALVRLSHLFGRAGIHLGLTCILLFQKLRISLGNFFLNDGLKNCRCHKAVSKSTTCSEVFEDDQLPHQQCRFSPQSGQFAPISSVSSEGRCKRCNSTVCQKGLCQ